MIKRTWQREIEMNDQREKMTRMEERDECAVMGCDKIRKPAPKSSRFPRSKYCVDHAAEAKAKMFAKFGDREAKTTKEGMYEKVWQEAHEAGMKAGNEVGVTPMVVTQHTNMLDDNSPVAKQWYVADGACGFAWVKVRPANSSFAKWVVKTGKTSRGRDYNGGLTVKRVGEFNQSVQRKEAYASAFAAVLRDKLQINAYAYSRMD